MLTRDDIIRMARVAGCHDNGEEFRFVELRYLERFAALIAAAERKACADICDTTPPHPFRPSIEAAHAIRARSEA